MRRDRLHASKCLVVLFASLLSILFVCRTAHSQRSLGIDVSAWQGNLSQTTWNNLRNVNSREFVFIRSSRGGTTGYYNQNNPDNDEPVGQNTLSQRYDDPYFVQNITRATNAGMLAGPYHFSRPDVVASTLNSGGIANSGTDEANHFIQMAGAWMRPGYLLPVFDLEAGQTQRTRNQLAQFSIDFSDRIYEVTGVWPIMYINGNYSNYLQGASLALRTELVAKYPTLWNARYVNQDDPDSIPVQTANPGDGLSTMYGPWDDAPNPAHPWDFWQYASTATLSGFNNGNSPIDVNVAQGGIEFVKDQLVPALWVTGGSGAWTSLANWNSGQASVAPVQGPGQVARVGSLTLPTARLPGSNDTVILERPEAGVAVTLGTGSHNIRKLYVREALNITGGSLNINYAPSADSTTFSAQFSAPVLLSGFGALSVHTLQVDASQFFTLSGGQVTLNTINLMPHAVTPAKILAGGNLNFVPLSGAAAVIGNGAGAGLSGVLDLGGANRTISVSNGAAATDLTVNVPVTNGGLTKTGAGVLALTGANTYAGDTVVTGGTLRMSTATLANAADVYLASGAALDLTFDGADVIDSLFIDGVSMVEGIWGAEGSGAAFTSPLLLGTGTLRVTTFIPPPLWGDYNADGMVDSADYVVWRDALGGVDALPNDDTPGVGPDDYERWRTNFGATNLGGSGSAGGSAVPEPSSAVLLMVAWSFLRTRRGTRGDSANNVAARAQ